MGPRRLCQKETPKLPNMEAVLDAAFVKVKKQANGCLSPEMCFHAVKASVYLPFAEGIRRERELFMFLLTSGQAKALQYAFFAQRLVEKWALPSGASWKTAVPQPVRRAAVIGKTIGFHELSSFLDILFSVAVVKFLFCSLFILKRHLICMQEIQNWCITSSVLASLLSSCITV